VFSHSLPKENILSYSVWHVNLNNSWRKIKVIEGKQHGKAIIAKIDGIENIDEAKKMIGIDIYIEKSQLPKLAEDEHYFVDLVGLEVFNKNNEMLGTAASLFSNGAHNVLVVEGEKQYLIPYLKPFLLKVDIKNKKIFMDWDKDF
jgi:16S rRNA processing protein RimM